MSYLDTLLKGVEVKWKPLGEFSTIKTGKRVTKRQLSPEKKYPVYSGGVTPMGYFEEYNQDEKTITIVKYGTAGFVNFITEKFWANDVCYCVTPSFGLDNKYLLHLLKKYQNHIKSLATDAIPAHLPTDEINGLKIPIPCPDNPEKSLKIQKDIVHILDTFTELTTVLTTELTTELTARKKQYSFYRENLLTFNESEVKHLPMDNESLGEFIRGKRFVKTDMISEGVPCIHYGEMYTHYDTWADKTKSFVNKELVEKKNLRLAEKGDVVLVAAGETIEDIGKGTAWFGEEGVAIHDACFYYKSDLNPKYVAYFTRTRQFHDQIKKHIRTGKISAINAKGLGKAIIPIPSPEEQERIVNILDKFDVLTTSISEALPKEIELRKKQYEYYRNMLLTFPKDAVEI